MDKKLIKAYFDAWREVFRDSRLTSSDKSVMYMLFDMAYDVCWFSYTNWGERIGASRRTAMRALVHLHQLGYITTFNNENNKRDTVKVLLKTSLQPPWNDKIERLEGLKERRIEVTPKGNGKYSRDYVHFAEAGDGDTDDQENDALMVTPVTSDGDTGDQESDTRVTLMYKTNVQNERILNETLASLEHTEYLLREDQRNPTEDEMNTESTHDSFDTNSKPASRMFYQQPFEPSTDKALTRYEQKVLSGRYGDQILKQSLEAVEKLVNAGRVALETRGDYIRKIEGLARTFQSVASDLENVYFQNVSQS